MNTREPATVARRKKYGHANQLAHEAEGRYQRKRLESFFAASRDEAQRAGKARMANKAKEKGANAGTMGGSRGGLERFLR